MDNYPIELAPEFDDGGGVKTPFAVWWKKAKTRFSGVPEEVAQYWLHEHWGHSPFGYLSSTEYAFSRRDISSSKLKEIRSGFCNFDPTNSSCREHGAFLETLAAKPYFNKTAIYMLRHRTFPIAIVVLDNCDGHRSPPNVTDDYKALPRGLVLVEGHRRFDLALHLEATGRLESTVPIWLMSRNLSG